MAIKQTCERAGALCVILPMRVILSKPRLAGFMNRIILRSSRLHSWLLEIAANAYFVNNKSYTATQGSPSLNGSFDMSDDGSLQQYPREPLSVDEILANIRSELEYYAKDQRE